MNVASRLPGSSRRRLRAPMTSSQAAFLGFGLGLRAQHYDEILNGTANRLVRVISENYMLPGGQPLRILDRSATLSGGDARVSLSIASTRAPNSISAKLKEPRPGVQPKWVSDICAGPACTARIARPVPIPYTGEALDHVVSRVHWCRISSRALVLENVSTICSSTISEMTEWEFLSDCRAAPDAGCCFDINNVYVSAFNHGYDPLTFLNGIPPDAWSSSHADTVHMGTHIIDTHESSGVQDVWDSTVAMSGSAASIHVERTTYCRRRLVMVERNRTAESRTLEVQTSRTR